MSCLISSTFFNWYYLRWDFLAASFIAIRHLINNLSINLSRLFISNPVDELILFNEKRLSDGRPVYNGPLQSSKTEMPQLSPLQSTLLPSLEGIDLAGRNSIKLIIDGRGRVDLTFGWASPDRRPWRSGPIVASCPSSLLKLICLINVCREEEKNQLASRVSCWIKFLFLFVGGSPVFLIGAHPLELPTTKSVASLTQHSPALPL